MARSSMKAILVTGGSGFIGLAVGEALLDRGIKVVGFDLAPPPQSALRRFEELPGEFVHVRGNVQDDKEIAAAISENGVDAIIAMAAITADLDRERRDARSVIEVNVGGTIATLEAARATGVKRIAYIGSGSAYGAAGYDTELLDEEETPTIPESLYGISKLAAEQTALRLGDVFGLDVRVGRLGTCFGPWEYATGARDTPSAVFQIVRNFRSGKPVSLPRPHPKDWLYSRDAAQAIIALLGAEKADHRIYNLGAGFVWSLVDLCELLQKENPGFDWEVSDKAADAINLYSSRDRAAMACTRIQSLDYRPEYGLEAALPDYLEWCESSEVALTA